MPWYFFALISAFFSGIAFIDEKKALVKEHALEFSAVLAVANFLITLPLIGKVSFNLSFNQYLIIFLASLVGTIAFLLLAKGLRHIDISVVSPLNELSIIFTLIGAYIFLGERLTYFHFIGVFLLLFGAYLVQIEPHPHRFNILDPFRHLLSSKYFIFALSAIFLFGAGAVIDKLILRSVNPINYVFWIQFFIMVNFLIWISVFYDGFTGIKHGFKSIGFLVFIIALFTVLARFTYAQAVTLGSVTLVIAVKRLSNLISTIGGGKLFCEKHLLIRSIACIIMIVGTYFIIFLK